MQTPKALAISPLVQRCLIAVSWAALAAAVIAIVYLASHTWHAVAAIALLLIALAPAGLAMSAAPGDEEDWWNPI
jgi:hypothetical protein